MKNPIPAIAISIGVVLLHLLAGCAYHEMVDPPVAAQINGSQAFYSANWPIRKKAPLSNEMAAKLLEIISRKPTRYTRTIMAMPRGYILVGGREYAFHNGFITPDTSRDHGWDDPVFHRLWERLDQHGGKIDKLKNFKP